MRNGHLQKALAPLLLAFGNRLNYQNPRFLCNTKNRFLRLAGIQAGRRVIVSFGFQCIYPSNIILQDLVCLGHNNIFWAFHRIVVGSRTQTARDLLIVSGSHDVNSYEPLANQEVVIGQGCWIGARVTILGGVRVGKGCVIGAGSIVKESIPDWSIAVGSPARVVATRKPAASIWNYFGAYSPEDLNEIL